MSEEKNPINIITLSLSFALIISLIFSYSYFVFYKTEKNIREMEQGHWASQEYLFEEYEKLDQRLKNIESHHLFKKKKTV